MTTDKKAKEDFELHVRLLMKKHGVPKAKANFMAWLQGPNGLNDLLGTPKLPLDEGKK